MQGGSFFIGLQKIVTLLSSLFFPFLRHSYTGRRHKGKTAVVLYKVTILTLYIISQITTVTIFNM